ncbi:MAG: ribonuclease III [Oscillospiraceae bacterium]|nr:ribonuclease III [Oscillospiraceae bacterium]
MKQKTDLKITKKRSKSNAENSAVDFAKKIKYDYKDISLLETALTHSSYSNEMRSKGVKIECNQRLEFLGDSVLSLITSEYIYSKLKNSKEGELTRVRASIVCEDSLFKFAESINLGDALFLGKGEIGSNGRNRKSTLADAFEAVLGSVFLDGGFDAAKKFLFRFITKPIESISDGGKTEDHKSLLQQIIQQGGEGTLRYTLVSATGPDHEKIFEVNAELNNNIIGEGKGASKKEAEQNAAKEALGLFGYQN